MNANNKMTLIEDDNLGKGHWFFFNIDKSELAVFVGVWGRQVVYVDECTVSDQKNKGPRSVHEFNLHGKTFRLTVEGKRFLDTYSSIFCRLYEDTRLLAEEKKENIFKLPFGKTVSRNQFLLFNFAISFVVGLLVVLAMNKF